MIYLNDEEFDLLKVLRLSFLKRAHEFFKKRPKPYSVTKKQAVEYPISKDNGKGNGKIYPEYEPSKVESTRDSLLWSWRRFKEHYRDLQDEYTQEMIKEVHNLIYS